MLLKVKDVHVHCFGAIDLDECPSVLINPMRIKLMTMDTDLMRTGTDSDGYWIDEKVTVYHVYGLGQDITVTEEDAKRIFEAMDYKED